MTAQDDLNHARELGLRAGANPLGWIGQCPYRDDADAQRRAAWIAGFNGALSAHGARPAERTIAPPA